MLGCGVDDEPVLRHWRMVAATLHLGQIDFTSTQHSTQVRVRVRVRVRVTTQG